MGETIGVVFDRLGPDTIVIIDSHWESTVEHILSAHDHRRGHMTSSELPRGMSAIPYDYDGDPELAMLAAKIGDEMGTLTHASQDDYLPVYYATVNLVHYLHKDERVVSVMFSDYDNATGTGQAHVWFEKPDGGWTG